MRCVGKYNEITLLITRSRCSFLIIGQGVQKLIYQMQSITSVKRNIGYKLVGHKKCIQSIFRVNQSPWYPCICSCINLAVQFVVKLFNESQNKLERMRRIYRKTFRIQTYQYCSNALQICCTNASCIEIVIQYFEFFWLTGFVCIHLR